MAELSSKKRDNLPSSDFGIPSQRKYPMPDKAHAENALSRAKAAYDEGKLSKDTYEHIVRMADEKLGETPKGHGG